MKSMIVCALLITLSVLVRAAPTDLEQKIGLHATECMKDHNLKLDDFEKFSSSDPENFKIEDISDAMQCAVHCITMKMGLMDENGKLTPENIKPTLEDHEKGLFEQAFKECNEISGSNPCETALLTFGCMASRNK